MEVSKRVCLNTSSVHVEIQFWIKVFIIFNAKRKNQCTQLKRAWMNHMVRHKENA